MQFLVSVIDDGTGPETQVEQDAVDAFNEKLKAAGRWVFAGGLGDPSPARTIDDRAGRGLVTDGPFVESKEYLAGFWIMEADDLDEAFALGAEASRACNRKIEVRPFL
ncbi:hypothetical protein ASD11_08385 [Aeromicrobium sp. Root495]|uniref:YciI family protein n=1 Tax=Aeromicrobium sp. Root495 TaxID=1736550 RepID=UPI0006FB186C|nr:YciI family protein [Aeromicrobium sp. Root495]KQY59562.1 hypothetical protein ASD11_08385 [Aeromicrobium sp. Root495]